MFPEVTRLLTSHTGNTSNSEDILSSACYTVRNLLASQPQLAKQYFSSSMVNNVVNLCRSRWAAGQAPQVSLREGTGRLRGGGVAVWGASVGLSPEARAPGGPGASGQAAGPRTSRRGYPGHRPSEGRREAGAADSACGSFSPPHRAPSARDKGGDQNGGWIPPPQSYPPGDSWVPPGGRGRMVPLCRVTSFSLTHPRPRRGWWGGGPRLLPPRV